MAYGYYRAVSKSPSRKKKRLAEILSRQVEVTGTRHDGTRVTQKVDIKELPPYEIIFRLEEPGILCGRSPGAVVSPRSEVNIPDEKPLRKLRERLGLAKLNSPVMTFPLTSFVRTLAKIGHAYVMAEFGPKKVSSELAPIVLGDLGKEFYLVGGFDPELPQKDSPLQHRIDRISGDSWLVVEISLHFFPRLPRYQVVCGKVAVESTKSG